MTNISTDLLPLEQLLKNAENDGEKFPSGRKDYFKRYELIKVHVDKEYYKWIGAGTSAEDQGIYTDHSIDHFNSVIRYAGKLLGSDLEDFYDACKLTPYETYITLVSILLHDAGNIEGRKNHEKKTFQLFKKMGSAVCPDVFEAKPIANIAEAHGGKRKTESGQQTKDTIAPLFIEASYEGISYRARLIAAIVRFADEICESRNRAARFLLSSNKLPKKSEVFHAYADSISSVEVDTKTFDISIKYEITKSSIVKKYGKQGKRRSSSIYLIDEIYERLEKMFCELTYCKRFMSETVKTSLISANIIIYDDEMNLLDSHAIRLEETGYPHEAISIKEEQNGWSGKELHKKYTACTEDQ